MPDIDNNYSTSTADEREQVQIQHAMQIQAAEVQRRDGSDGIGADADADAAAISVVDATGSPPVEVRIPNSGNGNGNGNNGENTNNNSGGGGDGVQGRLFFNAAGVVDATGSPPVEVPTPNGGENNNNSGSGSGDSGVQGRKRTRRDLKQLTGEPLTALVVIVVDSVGSKLTGGSVAKLENDVFLDAVSLKTQYDACSYGKLQINPFVGTTSMGRTITKGVTELVLPTYKAKGGDRKQIQNAALAAVKTDISNDFKQEFDLVLFCMVRI